MSEADDDRREKRGCLRRIFMWIGILTAVWFAIIIVVAIVLAATGNLETATDENGTTTTLDVPDVSVDSLASTTTEANDVAPTSDVQNVTANDRLKATTDVDVDEARPAWCRHYDSWNRHFSEHQSLADLHGDQLADWPDEDLQRWSELNRLFGESAQAMWAEAPDEVNWETAHVACDPNRSVPYPLTAQEALEPCVSAWDGSHEGFEQLIKDELNDPGSMDTHGLYFNPQEGTGKGTVRLQLDYSAANVFGGKVRYKAVALMDVESCEIVEVMTYGW